MNANPAKNLPLIHSKYLYSAQKPEILSLMDAEILTDFERRWFPLSSRIFSVIRGRTMAIFGTAFRRGTTWKSSRNCFRSAKSWSSEQTPELGEEFAERASGKLRKAVPPRNSLS